MTIDIIDLTDPAYSDLSPIQLAMVRAAQAKKDDIVASYAREKEQALAIQIAGNTARSAARGYQDAYFDRLAEEEVDGVREDLLYQLAYEALGTEGNEKGPYRYPENPNYTLTPSQRFLVVRNYYMEVTDDPSARLAAYRGDTLARSYLGEFYETLYDLLARYV